MSETGIVETGRRTEKGHPVWEITTHALERLSGFHRSPSSLRAKCPAHDGDNQEALRVNEREGRGLCAVCGAVFFVVDNPEQRARQDAWERSRDPIVTIGGRQHRIHRPAAQATPGRAVPIPTAPAPSRPVELSSEALNSLHAALDVYADRLPDSDGAAYLAQRHIPLAVATHLGWGWGGDRGDPIGLPSVRDGVAQPWDFYARRVVMPLSGPDGTVVGAFGRAVDDDRQPKYKALDGRGVKALTNGIAIAEAVQSGQTLIVVEGPLDAASIIAGGLSSVVAIGSTRYPWPAHFRGVRHVTILPDNDGEAGEKGARKTREALELEGVTVTVLDPVILFGHKDAAECWQHRQHLPAELVAASQAIVAPSRWAGFGKVRQTG